MKSSNLVIPSLFAIALAGCGGGGGGGTPPLPTTLTITGLPASAKLAAFTNYTLSVSENADGAPVTPGAVTFTLGTAAVGTIVGSTLTTGIGNASGVLTATDSAHHISASITVAVGSTHPATAGDTVSFAGTLTEKIVRPQPAPVTVQPPYTFTYAVSITSATSTGKTFAGKTALDQFTTVETDTGSLPPLPVTTTNFFQKTLAGAAGAYDVVSYGSTASDTNGTTNTTTFGAGNGLLDILPETNGRTWQNSASETYAEKEPDSTMLARTAGADGSYKETDTFADVTQPVATLTVNSNISGSYVNAPLRGIGVSNLTFGVPVTTAGHTVIPITIVTFGVGTASSVADWYPSPHLYANSALVKTAQTIPASCGVPAILGTSATAIVETTTRLDPVLGTYESRNDTTYLVPFYGTACTVLADTLTDYYDYSAQTGAPAFGSVPQQITTLAETIGFKAGTIGGAVRVATTNLRTENAAQVAPLRTALALGRSSFEHAVQRLYRERRKTLRAYLRNTTSLKRAGR